MATLSDVAECDPEVVKLIKNLFRAANYCFATKEPGRSPTFYFAHGGLKNLNNATLSGRLRTMHPNGPMIDVATVRKQHMFFDARDTQTDAHAALKTPREITTPADLDYFVGQTHVTPAANRHHLEFSTRPSRQRPFSRPHRSGGVIVMQPPVPSGGVAMKIVRRILAGRCVVRRDGQDVFRGTGTAATGGQDVAAYLQGL